MKMGLFVLKYSSNLSFFISKKMLILCSYVAICFATLFERRNRLREFGVLINAAVGRINCRRPRGPITFCGFIFMLFCKHNK